MKSHLPSIGITAEARNRLAALIGLCETEISGLGRVQVIEGRLTVTEIYLLRQAASKEECLMDAPTNVAFLAAVAAQGTIPTEEIRFWWHSHVKASAYFSDTDLTAINGFDTAPWWISYVGNHYGESQARLDIFAPKRLVQPVVLETVYEPAVRAAVEREIAAHVFSPTQTMEAVQ